MYIAILRKELENFLLLEGELMLPLLLQLAGSGALCLRLKHQRSGNVSRLLHSFLALVYQTARFLVDSNTAALGDELKSSGHNGWGAMYRICSALDFACETTISTLFLASISATMRLFLASASCTEAFSSTEVTET